MNKIVKNTLILTIITLVSGLLLGIVYDITKEPIAASKEKAKQEAYHKVIAQAEEFKDVSFDEAKAKKIMDKTTINGAKANVELNEVAEALKGSDKIGYVVTVTDKDGYGGEIKISVGILKDGTVNGISILAISETAGLGMRAKEPKFYQQYQEKKVDSFTVTKNHEKGDAMIDALSGATITSKAVTGAVNGALNYFQNGLGGSANE